MKLLPCPFCGGSDIEQRILDIEDREGVPTALFCPDCGAQGPWEYERNGEQGKIIKAWNRRV